MFGKLTKIAGEVAKSAGSAMLNSAKKTGEYAYSHRHEAIDIAKKTGEVAKSAGNAMLSGAKKTGEYAYNHRHEAIGIAKKTGEVAKSAGNAMLSGARKTSEYAYNHRHEAVGIAKKTGEVVKSAGNAMLNGAKKTGEYAYSHRHEVISSVEKTGKVVKNASKTVFNVGKDLNRQVHSNSDTAMNTVAALPNKSQALISGSKRYSSGKERCKAQLEVINKQSNEYKMLTDKLRTYKRRREILLDSIGIAFDCVNNYIKVGTIPKDVQKAYELAYPNLAKEKSLTEAIEGMYGERFDGFVNSLKGKLFEVKYVEQLNNGELPDGYKAVLADSPTNPGWDVAILDSNGLLSEELQLKATDSLDYVQEAIVKYPHIKVVTTDEVYSQISMSEYANNVISGGISNEALIEDVETGLEISVLDNLGVPIVNAAIIGYQVSKNNNLTTNEKVQEFGNRFSKSCIASAAGGLVVTASGVVPLGIATAVGVNYYLKSCDDMKTICDMVDKSIKQNDKVLASMRQQVSNIIGDTAKAFKDGYRNGYNGRTHRTS